ncbi:MAG TPA: amidohydrolase family protein [Bryobacteraceae bacterium]|nr:amidohydrolase family protein [Bryobacteraceae bacterium]
MSYLRIAAEEAFAPPELLQHYRDLLRGGGDVDPGFESLWGHYLGKSGQATALVSRIQDLGEGRIRDMDESGIAKQILSLTAPGVQIFERDRATHLARSMNDQLAEAVRRHPGRFAGLAAIAPQDPAAAAQELERGVGTLGLKGAIINSHTHGEYLDDAKFWPIFEAAAALGVPVYIHPTTPPHAMIRPFAERGLAGAIFGFGVETGLHMLRLITSGVFDRFPNLQIVVGHLGEALPFWMFRVDFMHRAMVTAGRHPTVRKLQRKPSDYLRENFYFTTSGMAWEPVILFTLSVFGADRVLYAMDYPYQYVPEEVTVTDQLPISDDDKLKLYQSNAEKVFCL